jgi:hypothetical protein
VLPDQRRSDGVQRGALLPPHGLAVRFGRRMLLRHLPRLEDLRVMIASSR